MSDGSTDGIPPADASLIDYTPRVFVHCLEGKPLPSGPNAFTFEEGHLSYHVYNAADGGSDLQIHVPTQEQWRLVWVLCDEVDVWSWPQNLRPPDVFDHLRWVTQIVVGSRGVMAREYLFFVSADRCTEFTRLHQHLQEMVGWTPLEKGNLWSPTAVQIQTLIGEIDVCLESIPGSTARQEIPVAIGLRIRDSFLSLSHPLGRRADALLQSVGDLFPPYRPKERYSLKEFRRIRAALSMRTQIIRLFEQIRHYKRTHRDSIAVIEGLAKHCEKKPEFHPKLANLLLRRAPGVIPDILAVENTAKEENLPMTERFHQSIKDTQSHSEHLMALAELFSQNALPEEILRTAALKRAQHMEEILAWLRFSFWECFDWNRLA
jgi:hypothetical protein